ncbi:tetratricopeptide repeat protein [Geomonas sp. Red69]|uniref:tetratricopeptide repeat protein n=1 Tax=Geomonas diazotrophica TaxID=2843197 RepID=UPI001C0FA99F|nr:tetratricopeptide repeat protein [Geomonas diazotrophica]MBU5638968.1 tetratricopeptide repeat protein [Geomonas diazotrophica]
MGIFGKMFGKDSAQGRGTAPVKEINFITALSMHVRGELEPALSAYAGMAERDPNDFLALFFAAAIKAETGKLEEAVQGLREMSGRISESGDSISRVVVSELANLLADDSATVKRPAVTELVAAFGDLLKKEGQIREGAVCFEVASGLAPDNAHVLYKLGDTLHDLRIYDYAESVLLGALKHAPYHFGALYTYAVLLQDLGRNDEAIAQYEKAVKLVPTHVGCQNNYGAALLRANRLDEALQHCSTALELDPKAPLVKINLGYIYLLKKDFTAARKSFSGAIELNDQLAPAYFGLASAEQALESDPETIRELYQKAIEANPAIAEVHHALANLLASKNDPHALAHYAKALQLNSSLPNLRRDYGYACLQQGKRDEALEQLKLAVMLNPEDTIACDLLAQAQGAQSEA